MRTKAEMGVMQPEAEESREPQKLEEARTGDGREGSPADALTLGSWLPELPRGLKSLILSFLKHLLKSNSIMQVCFFSRSKDSTLGIISIQFHLTRFGLSL